MTASPDRGLPLPKAPAGHAVRAVYARLAERVAAALAGPPRQVGPVMRLEVRAEGMAPLEWLAAQTGSPRVFWSDRDQARCVAGVGVADRLLLEPGLTPSALVARVAGRLEGAAPGVRYYGGFRFDPEGPVSPDWRSFGRGWLVLPRFEWLQEGDDLWLACNVSPGRDSAGSILAALEGLADETIAFDLPGPPRWREDLPSRDEWLGLVGHICTTAGHHPDGANKVVLARRTSFTFDTEVEAPALLGAARRCGEPCFHFLLDPGDGAAFMGASPERLFHRRGRAVSSEALAGTRPRGASPRDDARLRGELLGCGKEGREHASVVRHIEERLERFTDGFRRDPEPSVVELAHVQHLSVRMSGRLKPGAGDADLMAALHPTPAVAGEPPLAALSRIAEVEPFDRGWYAGPVGYVGADDTQFAVAIRSALVRGHQVDLYAGAGILAGSRPEDEWSELESKMSGLESVWTHD